MAGTSDYKKQIKREKSKDEREQKLAEKAKKKLWVESIGASEFAAFLSCYSRNNVHFDRAKLLDRIEEICVMSDGLLKEEDFRVRPITQHSRYVFPPETHGLILTLLDTGYFDNRKNARKLSTRENLYRELTVNIELYLRHSEEDKNMVMSNPAFASAKCESILSEAINQKMTQVIRDAMNADEVIRLKLLKRTYDTLNKLCEDNETEIRHLFSSKLVYKYSFEDVLGKDFFEKLFEDDSLIKYLIHLLALRVNGKEFNELDGDEKLTYPLIYAHAAEKAKEDKLWVELGELDPNEVLEDLKIKCIADNKYESILMKALDLFDKNDADEMQLYRDLVYITQLRFMAKKLTVEGAEASKTFYEAAFSKDMFDMFNQFANGDFNSPVMEELRRIRMVSAINNKEEKTEN